jgi:mono/diheme cytochrome c family protein
MRLIPVVALLVSALFVAGCGSGNGASRPRTGKEIYRAYCLTCHGADGQGGVGPPLAGVVAQKYPNIEDQIAVVETGRRNMPSFRGTLTPREFRKVVEYERTELGT